MVVADLHVHTEVSDGTLAVADVPAAARAAGLEAVAVTDHDRINPHLSAPVTTREGVTLVNGIELRVAAGDQRVDLLGYGVRPHPGLVAVVSRLQADRIDRARRMVEQVEERLDVTLDVDYDEGVGRPHVARAIAASDAEYDYQGAFEHLIGDGGPCYVARDVPSFAEGRAVLRAACEVVGLAHPLRYEDPAAALARAADLDAVELYYPYEGDPDPEPVVRAAEAHDLLVTGGSDAHGEDLGRAGLDRADWRAVRSALGE
ncbi:MAG: PHP domain-containing protein [Halorientalis sp.]